ACAPARQSRAARRARPKYARIDPRMGLEAHGGELSQDVPLGPRRERVARRLTGAARLGNRVASSDDACEAWYIFSSRGERNRMLVPVLETFFVKRHYRPRIPPDSSREAT